MGNIYVLFGLLSIATGEIIMKKVNPVASLIGKKYQLEEGLAEIVQMIVGFIIFSLGTIVVVINVIAKIYLIVAL